MRQIDRDPHWGMVAKRFHNTEADETDRLAMLARKEEAKAEAARQNSLGDF